MASIDVREEKGISAFFENVLNISLNISSMFIFDISSQFAFFTPMLFIEFNASEERFSLSLSISSNLNCLS